MHLWLSCWQSDVLIALCAGHSLRVSFVFARWGNNTTAVTIDVPMPMKSGFVGAVVGRRSGRNQTVAPPHTRTEVVDVPRVSMGRKCGSLRSASASTKEDSFSSVYPSSSSSRAETKRLEKCLATRASDLVGPLRVCRSLSESSVRRRAAVPVS
jgi:hypothetical protein